MRDGTGLFSHCGQGHSPPHPVGEGAAYTRRVGAALSQSHVRGGNECRDRARFHHRRDGVSPPPGGDTGRCVRRLESGRDVPALCDRGVVGAVGVALERGVPRLDPRKSGFH
jgi:hypothetical protein